jgi:glucosamine-6-phosphate deaminase
VASAIRVTTLEVDALTVRVFDDLPALARAAAVDAAETLRRALDERGEANVLLATGNSQLAFLAELVQEPGIRWERVRAFHMDEYVGLPASHPASFQRYMRDRVAALVPIGEFHYLDGTADPEREVARYEQLLQGSPLDCCCCGIGENGHLAFNDPPVADFGDPRAVKVVALDDASRRQQVGEGHFATMADVPTHAITVTIPALLAARRVLAIVPEARKVAAVRAALYGPVTTVCPASILRTQPQATLYLDRASAAALRA